MMMRDDDSWVKEGCNNPPSSAKLRKRTVEETESLIWSVVEELKDDKIGSTRRLGSTCRGEGDESVAVGSNLGSSGLRKNGFGLEFGGGEEKGEREAGLIYNGLSQQPKPI